MRVSVTHDHIKKAKRGTFHACPIALALRDVNGGRVAIVTTTHARMGALRCDLPAEAKKFIDDFDREQSVEPFEFDLECQEGR